MSRDALLETQRLKHPDVNLLLMSRDALLETQRLKHPNVNLLLMSRDALLETQRLKHPDVNLITAHVSRTVTNSMTIHELNSQRIQLKSMKFKLKDSRSG
jgi:hypothetical protein